MSLENYDKGEVKEIESPQDPRLSFHSSCIHMKVNNGSKIKNLMGYAMAKMKDDAVRQITWNGSAQAVTKALSCAEIMKRKVKNLHQISSLHERKEEEYWEPKAEGLERLRVVKNYPALTILLSKDELDTSHPGYQAPGVSDGFWKKPGAKRQEKRKTRQGPDVVVPLDKKQKGGRQQNKDMRNRPQKGQNKGKTEKPEKKEQAPKDNNDNASGETEGK